MDLRVIDMNEVRELIYRDEFGEEVIMMSELEPLLMDFDKVVDYKKLKDWPIYVDGYVDGETLHFIKDKVLPPEEE